MGKSDSGAMLANRPSDLPPIGFRLDRRLPISEQVYDALRDAILRLTFPPRTAISENSLCREFGVSRTPVRAAIQRLAEERLIDVFPNQGSFVAPIDLANMQDSHFVRRTLELALLDEASKTWTAEKSAIGWAIIERMLAAERQGDVDLFLAVDQDFHQIFAGFAGRPGVWPTVLAQKTKLRRFFRVSGSDPKRLPAVIEEHAAVLAELDRGDAKAAGDALAYHLDRIFVMFDPLPEEYRRYFAD